MLERQPQVRLVIAGYLHLGDGFRRYSNRVRQLGFTEDVAAYWEALSGADINLAVLAPGPFADAKSEIKWLEAAMCSIPSIVSATRTYREILTDGQDVLLAETVEDWKRALSALIADPELRRSIGRKAREKACSSYGLAAAVEILKGVLPPPPKPSTPPSGPVRLDAQTRDFEAWSGLASGPCRRRSLERLPVPARPRGGRASRASSS
ncbi:glycosyltransferase involved in cell wall biosynthesis [Methylorubrum extorquens]